MPKIKLDRTIQFNRATYKLGDIVEISVENVEKFSQYGTIIEEEQQKETDSEQPKKSTRKSAKRIGK